MRCFWSRSKAPWTSEDLVLSLTETYRAIGLNYQSIYNILRFYFIFTILYISLDINPLSRHTLWTLAMGGSFHILQSSIVNQNMIQRYLSLPTLKDVNTALWIFVIGLCFIVCLGCYSGLLIYATFYNCDPLTTMVKISITNPCRCVGQGVKIVRL